MLESAGALAAAVEILMIRWTREVCSVGGEEICQEAQKLPEPPVKT